MKKNLLFITLFAVCQLLAADIYMAGDSTMASYPARRKPLCGWGQKLHLFTKPGVKVFNHGASGTSSKSFRNSGLWDKLLKNVKPGDFVIIQFGHNDSASGEKNLYRYTDPATEFPANLRRFIKDVREKGAVPVLVTLTVCRQFNAEGKAFNPDYAQRYVDSTVRTAKEEKVDFVDLNAWMLEELTRLGKEGCKKYYLHTEPGEYPAYPEGKQDNVHYHERGGEFLAKAFVKLAAEQGLPIADLFKELP